ncbi:hypothetical protein PFICI_05477 [Pestalotiopsis fici W106-1]|uniref:DUF6923 domain-containing protein n=1 Tax=Pestalotiopsis fici (strain W106-1 / CGMCC3.15140) TaxID=1229662 RepID=W3XEI1_PESFW|nr:uncharacterized protein PFICI_05477 [Pestalotiopsis fici W106-1]ETS83601.1 hypothetical protein PFICI_05477 [Pestalotiopsis fici W106-1]
MDAATNAFTTVKSNVGGSSSLDAVGLNIADGYLYAVQGSAPSRLLRISTADGSTQDMGSLNLTTTYNTGVVDESSQYWIINTAGTSWVQIDLRPGLSTFGRTVASGTSATPAYAVQDWAWVPGANGGNYLYGLGSTTGLLGGTYLMQWNRATKTWANTYTYLNILGLLEGSTANWASVWAGQDGTLFGYDNGSGQVYNFVLPTSGALNLNLLAAQVATGSKASLSDGARCVRVLNG